jgi:hypothetical protein
MPEVEEVHGRREVLAAQPAQVEGPVAHEHKCLASKAPCLGGQQDQLLPEGSPLLDPGVGSLIRELIPGPSRDYQPLGRPPGPPSRVHRLESTMS